MKYEIATAKITSILAGHLGATAANERARNIAQGLACGMPHMEARTMLVGHVRIDALTAVVRDIYRAWITTGAPSNLDAWVRLQSCVGDSPEVASKYCRDNGIELKRRNASA